MTTVEAYCLIKACLQIAKAEAGVIWVMMRAILVGLLPEILLVERRLVVYLSLVSLPV